MERKLCLATTTPDLSWLSRVRSVFLVVELPDTPNPMCPAIPLQSSATLTMQGEDWQNSEWPGELHPHLPRLRGGTKVVMTFFVDESMSSRLCFPMEDHLQAYTTRPCTFSLLAGNVTLFLGQRRAALQVWTYSFAMEEPTAGDEIVSPRPSSSSMSEACPSSSSSSPSSPPSSSSSSSSSCSSSSSSSSPSSSP
ncbi:DNA topoisomerase [Balamuthia mandrillaris]